MDCIGLGSGYLALLVFIVGLLLMMNERLDRDLTLIALLCLVVLTGNFYEHLGIAKKTKDERLARTTMRSMSYSW